MLVATQHAGFGSGGNLVQTLIDRTAGTAIGDMTTNGGLAASFDGVLVQTQANSSRKTGATQAFIGKDWGAGVTHRVSGFKGHASSDQGFVGNIDPQVTITLQGSTDNFSASIVDLGNSPGETDSNGLIITKLTGIDTSIAYRYHRLKITHDGAANPEFSAECQFFEDVEG